VALVAVVGCAGPPDGNGAGAGTGVAQEPLSLEPPREISVTVSGPSILLSFEQPLVVPQGYKLWAGPAPDSLEFVGWLGAQPGPVAIGSMMARGRQNFLALQSYADLGRQVSALSAPVAVMVPPLQSVTLSVDCAVERVNGGPYRVATGFQGDFTPGSCVTGTFHRWDMRVVPSRIYAATYVSPGGGSVLDMGVVDPNVSEDPNDYYWGPYPSLQFVFAPLDQAVPGSSWATWRVPGESALPSVMGAVLQDAAHANCLDGIAMSGSLTVVEATGLDQPGSGSVRVQGTATIVDPVTIPGLCQRLNCCLDP
jgi:hypothetical protein